MATSKEDMASKALARLGEGPITSFTDGSELAEKVNALYEPTILDLLAQYPWQWASERVALVLDGAVTPANEWSKAFTLPTLRTDRVGNPYRVYNSTALRAPEFFDYELDGGHLLTNESTIVIEYTKRQDETVWPGYFELLAAEALAAVFALPITENASKEEWHTVRAFGTPGQGGEGGLFARAMRADSVGTPTRSLIDETDIMTATRFGGSQRDGRG